jgi:hypothetical protein
MLNEDTALSHLWATEHWICVQGYTRLGVNGSFAVSPFKITLPQLQVSYSLVKDGVTLIGFGSPISLTGGVKRWNR